MASRSARLITAPTRSQAGCAAGPLCAHFVVNFWETINRDPGSVASAAVVAEAQQAPASQLLTGAAPRRRGTSSRVRLVGNTAGSNTEGYRYAGGSR